MNKTDKLRSVFLALELTLITMLAIDVKNSVFWIVWGIALILMLALMHLQGNKKS